MDYGKIAYVGGGNMARALAGGMLAAGYEPGHLLISEPLREHRNSLAAELPGTVVLRGDRDADLNFAQVPGRRFVYVADCETESLSVHEVDTLTNLAPAADPDALEFGPARYYYDAEARRLYISTSDFQPTSRHRYTIGVLTRHGFHMFKCRRVVLDGLAASGYRTAVAGFVRKPTPSRKPAIASDRGRIPPGLTKKRSAAARVNPCSGSLMKYFAPAQKNVEKPNASAKNRLVLTE